MNRLVPIAKNLLLAFVLITIGFALGKETTRRRITLAVSRNPEVATAQLSTADAEQKVVIYYAHTTFRCVTCNTIEELAKKTVESRFGDASANGLVEWRVVNFQEDEGFAKRHEIVSSCVVVAGMKGDKETGYRRLDKVWTKVDDPVAFDEYVASAVQEFLPAEKGGTE